MRTIKHIISALVAAIIIVSCAQQVSPVGGPKDTTPPKIKKSTPENFSTNFTGTEIELKFDEFVQLNNISQQMVISPSIENRKEPKLNGKSVTIDLGDQLKPNTTYQVNLGQGIADWHEKNPLDSNLFVFSTGDYIDSLDLKGTVTDAFSHLPNEGVLVMLYEDDYDSIPYKETPTYFAKTDKSGNFDLGYLKAGTYKIVALKDLNNNYLYDNPEEEIGYYDNITLPDSTNFKLITFKEKPSRNQYVESAKLVEYGHIRILLNEPAIDFQVEAMNYRFKKGWFVEEMYTNKDTVDLWLTDLKGLDSLELVVIDSVPLDTFYLDLTQKEMRKNMSVSLNTNSKNELDYFKNLKLTFPEPIKDYKLDSVIMVNMKDSSTTIVSLIEQKKNMREFMVDFKHKEGERYVMKIPPGQFISIFDTKNDTIKKQFDITTTNKYANLELEVVLDSIADKSEHYVLQLLNEKKTVITQKELSQTGKVLFEHLNPGKYTAVLIFDDNQNNDWDTGNYLQKRMPERAVAYDGVIEIKGGWDVELSWTIILKD